MGLTLIEQAELADLTLKWNATDILPEQRIRLSELEKKRDTPTSRTKHVVNFSGGLCSFWAAHRVVQKHGPKDVILLFADTMCEDPDLYTFNQQASVLLRCPLVRVADGRDPWQLFSDEGLIANNKYPICSTKLKRKLLDKWREENCDPANTVVYAGFDWTEAHRLADLQRELKDWRVEAPMTEEPIWDKCRMQQEAEKLGLITPSLYLEGFPHNNCGGRCVKAGISHWVHLLKMRPKAFQEWEQKELMTAFDFSERGIKALSILRDRRGGITKNLWLRDLRLRVEAGEQFTRFDWGGCGCGGANPKDLMDDPMF